MGKVVDITEKLGFEENPKLKVKDVELEVNTDAKTVLQIMGIIGNGEDVTPDQILEMCELIFTEDAKEKLDGLQLNFDDYQTVVGCAINLVTGEEEPVGEYATQATT